MKKGKEKKKTIYQRVVLSWQMATASMTGLGVPHISFDFSFSLRSFAHNRHLTRPSDIFWLYCHSHAAWHALGPVCSLLPTPTLSAYYSWQYFLKKVSLFLVSCNIDILTGKMWILRGEGRVLPEWAAVACPTCRPLNVSIVEGSFCSYFPHGLLISVYTYTSTGFIFVSKYS